MSKKAPATGRAVLFRKRRPSEVFSFDLADLKRDGALDRPFIGHRGPVHVLEDGAWPHRFRLSYIVLAPDGRRRGLIAWPYKEGQQGIPDDFWALPFTKTWPHFARDTPRYWFVAPCCQTRRRAVYLVEGRWLCRECAGLSYESRQKHRQRFWEIAEKPLAAQMAYFVEVDRPRVNRRRLMAAWRRLKRAHEAALAYHAGIRR